MRTSLAALVIAWLAFLPRSLAQEPALPTAANRQSPAAELGADDAIILGLVEGVTEFIPISSTGHLIIATDLQELNSNQPIFNEAGEPLWYRHTSEHHPGELLTLNLATEAYIVVIQFGAIAAVAPVCWVQLVAMWRGLLGRDPVGRRLFMNVMMAFLPSAVIGVLIHDWIDEHLFSVGAVIFALIAGSLLMFFAEYWSRRQRAQGILPTTTELTPFSAAGIGLLQCLAMWPGTSRPMMTIVGGYFAGFPPHRAAAFSFLLGFVTLSAASIFKTYQSGAVIIQVFGWPHVLLGGAVAAITSALSVRFFVKLLIRYGLTPFAWYRLVLAAVLALVYYRK